MEATDILTLVRRLVSDGERIAATLATREPTRVVDLLCDRAAERACNAPIAGVVDIVPAGALICPSKRRPKPKDLTEALESMRGSPLGGWARDAWLVPSPVAVLVARGTAIDETQPFVKTTCTLDQIFATYGKPAVAAAIAAELDLPPADADAIAIVMTSYLEAFVDYTDETQRVNGVLVPRDAFEAAIEAGTYVVGVARVLGLPAIAQQQSSPPPPPSSRDRWFARTGLPPAATDPSHYIQISEAALSAAMQFGRRDDDEAPLTGWSVVATSEDVPKAKMGYVTLDELFAIPAFARAREAWELALALPTGWSFIMTDGYLLATSPAGRQYELD